MKNSFCLPALLFLFGCSSAGMPSPSAGVQQKVTIVTPGTAGAHCFVQSGAKNYAVATPGFIQVQKSSAALDVTCFKGEHLVGNARILPTVAPNERASEDCLSCLYPATVSVAMGLDEKSMQKSLREWRAIP